MKASVLLSLAVFLSFHPEARALDLNRINCIRANFLPELVDELGPDERELLEKFDVTRIKPGSIHSISKNGGVYSVETPEGQFVVRTAGPNSDPGFEKFASQFL